MREKVQSLIAKCEAKGIRFDMRPKVKPAILDDYYTPGASSTAAASIRSCTRVSFSGKVYFARSSGWSATSGSRWRKSGRATPTSTCGGARGQRHLPGLPAMLQGRIVRPAGRRMMLVSAHSSLIHRSSAA